MLRLPFSKGKLKKRCMSLNLNDLKILTFQSMCIGLLKPCMDFIKHPEPAWCEEFEALMKGEFEMSAMGEMTFFLGLQFDMESVRTATTPYEAAKSKLKDESDPPVNVHLQENFQVSERATKLRKSTTGGCQFLDRRLISWQCKKQTIMATSSTEAKYITVASCCGQNPVFHKRTKHIETRHHFIRDANEMNLIHVLKIHTDDNVADLLTKAFDGLRFEFLVVHIGMMNRHFRLNLDADDGLDLWRDVNMLCRSLHADDVEEFWRDKDDWIVSSWTLYTKSIVHVLDLTNGKTLYMFMGSSYPIRATLLERMLRHRLTVPPSYCRHLRVGGIVVVHVVRLILLFLDDVVLVYAACVIAAVTLYLLK
nr:hypothetical protein [Tanacetum cinerariifolium]